MFEEAEQALDWARAKEEAITADSIALELSSLGDALTVSKQVYTALASLTDGEALSIVMNDPACNGLECWRRLNKRFDPQTAGRHKNAMAAILSVKSVSLKELPAAIEKWEQKVRHYEDSAKRAVPDDVKTAALTEMCPQALAQHVRLHYARLDTYDKLREEIRLYLLAQPDSGPAPMEIGYLGDKGNGKGGKGNRQPAPQSLGDQSWSWKGSAPTKSKGKGKAAAAANVVKER